MGLRRAVLALAGVLLVSCGGEPDGPELSLPPRAVDAPGGEEIAAGIDGLELPEREERIVAEVSRGNVPGWWRTLVPVELTRRLGEREHRIIFWVTPDYLTVGREGDSFLVPLSPRAGQRIADLVEGALPTPLMVDAIWEAADARLSPIRIPPDRYLRSVRYFRRHDRLVNAQRSQNRISDGTLVAGHKKDVVLSPRLEEEPGRVAIYGWHDTGGRPIQPLSTVLTEEAVDYSHGVRIVHRNVLVDGEERDLVELLEDPERVGLLSREGPMEEARYPVATGSAPDVARRGFRSGTRLRRFASP